MRLTIARPNVRPGMLCPRTTSGRANLALAEIVLRTLKEMDPRYPKLSFDPKTIKIK